MSLTNGIYGISSGGLVLHLDAKDTINYSLSEVEVLVVAGGGAGGNHHGGGGGGGGLIYNSNFAVTPGTAITVTVGNGGAGRAYNGGTGGNGGNSIFGILTAIGGGGGGSYPGSGSSGGSGGGPCNWGVSGSGGTGTAGQGFNGYRVNNGENNYGGGGGGAGEPGGQGKARNSGGRGLPFTISGILSYYSGGGGSGVYPGYVNDTSYGSGGLGGGGNGGNGPHNSGTAPTPGTPNTGGGGGGVADLNQTSGEGGSGVVIVRYPGPQKATGGNTITNVGGYTIHTFTSSGTFTPLAVPANAGAVYGLQNLSGNNNTGTQSGGVTYNTANGGSLSFDGSDDYVSMGSLGSGFSNFTVEIWFKSDSVANYRNPIDCNFLIENGSYSNLGPRLEQNSSGTLGWVVGSGSDVYTGIAVVSSGLDVSKYHYAAITKSSSTLFTTYYNGSAVTSTNFSNWTGSMLNVNIGRGFSLSGERWFIGKIPSVKIYNRALTATEILQNYNATKERFGI